MPTTRPPDQANKKAKITPEHVEEAARLKAIWNDRKDKGAKLNQAQFGGEYGIGKQGAVANYLNAHSALNLNAAQAFAKGLKCSIAEFSPRLAAEAEKTAMASGLAGLALPPHWVDRLRRLSANEVGRVQQIAMNAIKDIEAENANVGNKSQAEECPLQSTSSPQSWESTNRVKSVTQT